MSSSLRLQAALFLALLLPSFAVAQVVGGTLNGVVTDSTGAPVVSATVHVRNEDTGTERRLLTDSAGRYAAPLSAWVPTP